MNFGAPFKLKALSAIPATSSFNFENIKLTGNALNVLVSRTLLHEVGSSLHTNTVQLTPLMYAVDAHTRLLQ